MGVEVWNGRGVREDEGVECDGVGQRVMGKFYWIGHKIVE